MKKFFAVFLALAIFAVSACGTLLKPNQVGKRHSSKIDTKIAVLNAVGLLFGIIPGVVAFAVDYYNGTLFLPRGAAVKIDNMDAASIQKVLADNGYNVSIEEVKLAMATSL